MYLHIYKDCVINNKDVIGIFNINNMKESKINIEFLVVAPTSIKEVWLRGCPILNIVTLLD